MLSRNESNQLISETDSLELIDLPPEIWAHIIEFLPTESPYNDLLQLRLTCTFLKELAEYQLRKLIADYSVKQISIGEEEIVILFENGNVASLRQIKDFTTLDTRLYTVASSMAWNFRNDLDKCLRHDNEYIELKLKNVKQIVSGDYFSLALTADGKVYSWGRNHCSQLGRNSEIEEDYNPQVIPNLEKVVSISACGSSALALTQDGSVYAWGNHNAQLRLAPEEMQDHHMAHLNMNYASPTKIPTLEHVSQISINQSGGFALLDSKKIKSWGYNECYETGHDDNAFRIFPPREIPNLEDVSIVKAGNRGAFVRDYAGKVYAWGCNHNDQFGSQIANTRSLPTERKDYENALDFAVGGKHTIVLKANRLMLRGSNKYGQLGRDTQITSSYFQIPNIKTFAAGHQCSVLVNKDDELLVCGKTPCEIDKKFIESSCVDPQKTKQDLFPNLTTLSLFSKINNFKKAISKKEASEPGSSLSLIQ